MRSAFRSLFLIIIVLFTACQKEDQPSSPMIASPGGDDVSAFSQLTPGNYWVYDHHRVDSLDIIQPGFHHVDSFVVVGDTMMNGYTFSFIQRYTDGVHNSNPGFGVFFWRDSADIIISGSTPIFASATFNEDIHVDSIPAPNTVAIHFAVSPQTVNISTAAGTFDSHVVTGTCYTYGDFWPIPEWKFPRTYWAAGVGRVKWYEFYAAGDLGNRYELRTYFVQ